MGDLIEISRGVAVEASSGTIKAIIDSIERELPAERRPYSGFLAGGGLASLDATKLRDVLEAAVRAHGSLTGVDLELQWSRDFARFISVLAEDDRLTSGRSRMSLGLLGVVGWASSIVPSSLAAALTELSAPFEPLPDFLGRLSTVRRRSTAWSADHAIHLVLDNWSQATRLVIWADPGGSVIPVGRVEALCDAARSIGAPSFAAVHRYTRPELDEAERAPRPDLPGDFGLPRPTSAWHPALGPATLYWKSYVSPPVRVWPENPAVSVETRGIGTWIQIGMEPPLSSTYESFRSAGDLLIGRIRDA